MFMFYLELAAFLEKFDAFFCIFLMFVFLELTAFLEKFDALLRIFFNVQILSGINRFPWKVWHTFLYFFPIFYLQINNCFPWKVWRTCLYFSNVYVLWLTRRAHRCQTFLKSKQGVREDLPIPSGINWPLSKVWCKKNTWNWPPALKVKWTRRNKQSLLLSPFMGNEHAVEIGSLTTSKITM